MNQEDPMDYTDFANGETRLKAADKLDGLYHVNKLVSIFTK